MTRARYARRRPRKLAVHDHHDVVGPQIVRGSRITFGRIAAIVLNVVSHRVGTDFGRAVAGAPEESVRASGRGAR